MVVGLPIKEVALFGVEHPDCLLLECNHPDKLQHISDLCLVVGGKVLVCWEFAWEIDERVGFLYELAQTLAEMVSCTKWKYKVESHALEYPFGTRSIYVGWAS